MSKVTQSDQQPTPDTPTAEVIKKAIQPTQVTDDLGRVIKLRKPGVLAQFRLIEMLGAHAAANETYVNMIAPLMYISAIDDDDTIVMGTKAELEVLIQRLGEEGISAVQNKVQEMYKPELDPKTVTGQIKK